MSKIKLITDPEEINELYQFIKKYPLNYPNYSEWLKKCKCELELGYKKAYVCELNGKIIASLIFQPHKQDPLLLELKNVRVIEEYQRKKVFSTLLKEAIYYARQNGFKKIVVDAHTDNEVIKPLQKLGFSIESYENLYSPELEIVLGLDLSSRVTSLDSVLEKIQIKVKIIEQLILKMLKLLFI
ncbi:GNAT family N-acetyltransferase [Candidatus Woesearchaeota archaeon]|nr:hypothetical protein [uncultured archaeon]MBS3163241.1 GNAT family N-acetyltransferase [Candidatus Woesearchaeota archaeon]